MERLVVELDCKKLTCGKCKLAARAYGGAACGLFIKHLEGVKKDFRRLPECIKACKAQGKKNEK